MSDKAKAINDPMLRAAVAAGVREFVITAGGKKMLFRAVDDDASEPAETAGSAAQTEFNSARISKLEQMFMSLRNDAVLTQMEETLAALHGSNGNLHATLEKVSAQQKEIIALLSADVVPMYDGKGRVVRAVRQMGKAK